MFTGHSQASLGVNNNGGEELKVEEDKSEFFEYHFHPVPLEPVDGNAGTNSPDKNRVEVNQIEF